MLDWVTLGMAVLGLFVAALSLGWQIVEWMLSGSRVKATIGFALSAEGLTPGARLLSIAASNVGRARASVTSWAVMLPDKRTIVPAVQPDMWQGPDVPKGLDVGDGATWYVLLDPMVQARRNAGYTTASSYADSRRRGTRGGHLPDRHDDLERSLGDAGEFEGRQGDLTSGNVMPPERAD